MTEIRELIEIQGQTGNWDYDPYMLGLYNGMVMVESLVLGVEPVFRERPVGGFISEREQPRVLDVAQEAYNKAIAQTIRPKKHSGLRQV